MCLMVHNLNNLYTKNFIFTHLLVLWLGCELDGKCLGYRRLWSVTKRRLYSSMLQNSTSSSFLPILTHYAVGNILFVATFFSKCAKQSKLYFEGFNPWSSPSTVTKPCTASVLVSPSEEWNYDSNISCIMLELMTCQCCEFIRVDNSSKSLWAVLITWHSAIKTIRCLRLKRHIYYVQCLVYYVHLHEG